MNHSFVRTISFSLFSNIYYDMNHTSYQMWKFQRYEQVMEFEQTPFLPPPLTVDFAKITVMYFGFVFI